MHVYWSFLVGLDQCNSGRNVATLVYAVSEPLGVETQYCRIASLTLLCKRANAASEAEQCCCNGPLLDIRCGRRCAPSFSVVSLVLDRIAPSLIMIVAPRTQQLRKLCSSRAALLSHYGWIANDWSNPRKAAEPQRGGSRDYPRRM